MKEKTTYITYLRVSTAKQGDSGLGLEAQRASVRANLNGGEILREFVEVESGRKTDRPQLDAAIEMCQVTGACLLVAKFDRLVRDLPVLVKIDQSKIDVRALDIVTYNTFTAGIHAVLATEEVRRIRERTKAALDAKRARDGEWRRSNLTQAARIRGAEGHKARARENKNNRRAIGYLAAIEGEGLSLSATARRLNELGFTTARGKAFTAQQVKRLKNSLQNVGNTRE